MTCMVWVSSMIDHERRLLFIHISRTGGSSIELALCGRDWWLIDPASKHLSAAQARAYYGEEIWRRYVKFAVVRNPWDRVVSMWAARSWHQDLHALDHYNMLKFVQQLRPHPNENCGSLHYHEILDQPLDYVLRFEHLQQDLSTMLCACSLPDVALSRAECGVRGHYSNYYNDESVDLVRRLFRRDIELYGYDFEVDREFYRPRAVPVRTAGLPARRV